jgi:polysaccharide export outer membrane protein
MHRIIWVLSVFLVASAPRVSGADQAPAQSEVLAGYVLGPNDQLTVSVVELPEFSGRSYRIDADGTLSLPLLGRVHAAGLTLTQLENNLHDALLTQVRTPHVTANVAEARSQAVSVLGAVNTPGMQQIQGAKTLFDVLAAAGGLKPEAGELVTITRQASEGSLNLPNERKNLADGRSTADIKVRDVVELRDPKVNIVVRAHDEISVSRGVLLYVIGNVHKPGGFTLLQGHPVSALEALSMAEGLAPNASPGGARILRRTSETEPREQIPVNLKKILAGKAKDMQLSPDDILYVPDNTARRATTKTLETALATLSGVVIWRGF